MISIRTKPFFNPLWYTLKDFHPNPNDIVKYFVPPTYKTFYQICDIGKQTQVHLSPNLFMDILFLFH
jgi:hypothetical protein